MKLYGIALGLLVLTTSCQTNSVSEAQQFEASIRKELPFQVDTLRWVEGGDFVTFQFSNQDYVPTAPDAELRSDGALSVYRTFIVEPLARQSEDNIWRNVVVSRKNRRVICVDRYLREGRTQGYIYVLQSESKQFPTFGRFHWDVSDPHNIESAGMELHSLDGLAVRRLNGVGTGSLQAPTSQDAYWSLMFHADSLFADRLYAEAKVVYDLAFAEDRYILPSQLSTVAEMMRTIGNEDAALEYMSHRVRMESDFYVEPSTCPYPQLRDTFELRQRRWNYNLPLKERLEGVFERDEYNRTLWSQAANSHPEQTRRNDMLRARAWQTDSLNLLTVNQVLAEGGFPRRSQVGEFATLAVWLVFQHNTLEQQKLFLPQLEEAVSNGDIEPAYLATLKDRIDVREGRPQKYGTQMGPDGLCPLLDASRVNEWRQEVGLPPIER